MKINPKKLPFNLKKTREGYLITLPNLPNQYWGDTPEQVINEMWEKLILNWHCNSTNLFEIKNLLGIRK